jgi:hypothetical protein
MRRAMPYGVSPPLLQHTQVAQSKMVPVIGPTSSYVPQSAASGRTPMRSAEAFPRSHFGTNALIGLRTIGSLAMWVPINRPAPASSPVNGFSLAVPSRVAPNAIRVAIMVAQNFFSPSSHAMPAGRLSSTLPKTHVDQPSPGHMRRYGAQPPVNWKMPPKVGQRPSGRFSIPSPQTTSYWPTSSEWLASKLNQFGIRS